MDVGDVLRALGSDAAEAREAAELYLAVVGNPCTTRLKTVRRSVRRHLRRLFQLLGRPMCDVEALIRERAGAILGEDGVRAAAAVARELASRGATPVGASAAAVCAVLEAAGRSGCVRWASEAFGISDISLRRLLGRARSVYRRIRGGGSGELAGADRSAPPSVGSGLRGIGRPSLRLQGASKKSLTGG
jgi:hypothetical protein